MADVPLRIWTEDEVVAIHAQLARILASGPFQQSLRRQRFLEYLVTEALEGRVHRLKGYTLGVEIFDRPTSFDPVTDPIVRVEAARLRDKLREYYEKEGQSDPIRIEIPKGSYTPHIEVRPSVTLVPVTEAIVANPEDRPSRRALLRGPIGIARAVTSALFVLLVGWNLWRSPTPSMTPLSEKPSLAVLPFENIGGDPSWRRLADGMTQDITTDLSQSKDLLVIARNSTEIYRGKAADIRGRGSRAGCALRPPGQHSTGRQPHSDHGAID